MSDSDFSNPIHREDRGDGIVVLTFDAPGSGANVFNAVTLAALGEHIEWLAQESGIRGLVFASAKPSIFIAGADLKALAEASGAELTAMIETGQQIFNEIAALPFPTVAAIHGACLGGGLELALACDWRVASPDRATKIGLPETQLGILPAWGGSTRLPRLIGLPKAVDLILGGKQLVGKHARKLGVVDDVVPRERLIDRAVQLIARGKRKPDRYWLTNNRLAATIIRDVAGERSAKKTRGNYPAIERALDVVTRGVTRSVEDSLDAEREAVLELARGPVAEQLIRIFFLQEKAKKFHFAPGVESRPVERTAVIGAGVMGAGIAQWVSARGIPVILQDIDPARVAAGMKSVAKVYAGAVKRRIFTPGEAKQKAGRISPASNPVPLQRVDLVIEAAVERMDIKKQIFADLCRRSSEKTVLATNTSALPISELATEEGITHPERILGIHFFNPVHQMKLVEIVVTEQTSDEAVETALAFVRRIGKLPVVVKDSPGFLVNRILMPYLIEAGRLFERGIDPKTIDDAMLDFGMPMGPTRLLDEVGLDVALHVGETMTTAFGDRFAVPSSLKQLVEKGHTGKKSGRGFYRYDARKTVPNPDALALQRSADDAEFSREMLAERLALLMANEGFRVLEEGVADSADDIDFAMILGTGFAPFRGGPMTWANSLGLGTVREKLQRLVDSDGDVFRPAGLLSNAANLKELGRRHE